VLCVAFSPSARQSSLPGKNAPSALCRALDQNAHGKGCVVRIIVFAVRRRRTAKRTIPVVNYTNYMENGKIQTHSLQIFL
jgi:hypothetical protein